MKKKLLAILLTVCMVLSMAPAALAADSVFTDVNAGDWFAEEVKYVYDNDLMNGVGGNKFDPNGTVTRAMVWTTLARLDGVDTTGSDPWWLAGQKWAMENEISDGTMATENITREQLVTMIWRYAKYIEMDVSEGEDTNILSYTDAFDVNEWAISAMQWACAVGIINGIDGALQPQGDASRAMLAAILYRFVEEVMPEEEEPEPSPEPPTHICVVVSTVVTAPTCEERGYTTYTTCCGYSYKGNYVDALDHAYGEWTPNNDGTHSKVCGNDEEHVETEVCSFVDGVCEHCDYVAPVYLTPETANDILDKAETGTFVLTAGDYGTITMDEGDLNRNGITIKAEGVVTVENIILKDSIQVTDITIQGITFDGVSGTSHNTGVIVNSVDGLTVIDCDFLNGSGINCGEGNTLADVLIQDCTVDQTNAGTGSTYSPIYLSADLSGTVEIKDNEFTNSVYNAISLNGGDITAEVTISGNTIDTTVDRGLRLGTVAAGGSVAYNNNILTDAADNGNEVFKVSTVAADASVTFDGNTYNGRAWDPKDIIGAASNVVYIAPVYLTPETASAVLDKAESGIYVLTAGDYGTITMDEGDLNRNGITIKAEGVVTVENLILKDSTQVADITIQGITFDGVSTSGVNSGIIVGSVDGLTVLDCDFVNGSGINCGETHALSGVLIQDCAFDQTNAGTGSTYSPIYLSADLSGAVEIKDNEFTHSVYNAISLNGGDITAKVTISGNTIGTTVDRVLRFGTIKAAAEVTISGNTVTSEGDNGQMIKYTTKETNASVTLTGNTWNGHPDEQLDYANGVWSLVVPEGTTIAIARNADNKGGTHYGTIYVNSKEDLLYLSTLAENWNNDYIKGQINAYYYAPAWDIKLTKDIDFNNSEIASIPLVLPAEAYTSSDHWGKFDGQGHTISNVKIESGNGLFRMSGSHEVKDLTIDTIIVNATGNDYVGAVADSAGNLTNVHVINATVNGGKYVGGLAGSTYGNITDCSIKESTVTGSNKTVGGLVGYAIKDGVGGDIVVSDNLVEEVTVTGKYNVGGLLGQAQAVALMVENNTVKESTVISTTALPADASSNEVRTAEIAARIVDAVIGTNTATNVTLTNQ